MDPVIFTVHKDRGFIGVQHRHLQQPFHGCAFPAAQSLMQAPHPFQKRRFGNLTSAHHLEQLTNGARVNFNADAPLRRRLALHDVTTAQMRFDVNALRWHPPDNGLAQPGRGFGVEVCVVHLNLVCIQSCPHHRLSTM